MQLVERHIINEGHDYFDELDDLCFKSKNLYNATLYCVRQAFFYEKRYLGYYELRKKFTHRDKKEYRALPAKVAQFTMKLVEDNMKSFYALCKKKRKGEYDKPIKIPGYLHSEKGRCVVHYTKQALSFKKKKGFIHLSQTNIYVKSQIEEDIVNFVRVVPKGTHFVIEVGYKIEEQPLKPSYNRMVSIDLGLNNLMTLASNVSAPFIVNGQPLKSINQFYNKKIAKAQSKLPNGCYSSKRIKNLYKRRHNKIMDYLHKASRKVVNYLVANAIDTLIIGKNNGWKQNIALREKNNQNFVGIPFNTLIGLLEYKCRLEGINVVTQEEAYTSKCSFFDNEPIEKHDGYKGKRIKRGLFRTSIDNFVNADLNAALNILKKHCQVKEVWNNQLWLDCIGLCSTPNLQKITC